MVQMPSLSIANKIHVHTCFIRWIPVTQSLYTNGTFNFGIVRVRVCWLWTMHFIPLQNYHIAILQEWPVTLAHNLSSEKLKGPIEYEHCEMKWFAKCFCVYSNGFTGFAQSHCHPLHLTPKIFTHVSKCTIAQFYFK